MLIVLVHVVGLAVVRVIVVVMPLSLFVLLSLFCRCRCSCSYLLVLCVFSSLLVSLHYDTLDNTHPEMIFRAIFSLNDDALRNENGLLGNISSISLRRGVARRQHSSAVERLSFETHPPSTAVLSLLRMLRFRRRGQMSTTPTGFFALPGTRTRRPTLPVTTLPMAR